MNLKDLEYRSQSSLRGLAVAIVSLSTLTTLLKSCFWVRSSSNMSFAAQYTDLLSEEWLTAIGYDGVRTTEIPAWRRAHMSNLVNAFDFDHVRLQPFFPSLNPN